MFFIFTNQVDGAIHEVLSVHNNPDILPPEALKKGFKVNSIPKAPVEIGRGQKMMYNADTQEIFYESFEVEKSPIEKELERLQVENTELKSRLAEVDSAVLEIAFKLLTFQQGGV